MLSTITKKGQTTVPKEIRDFLHLAPGDKIEYSIGVDGRVTLVPVNFHINSLRGIIKNPFKKPLTLAEIEEAIASGYAREKS